MNRRAILSSAVAGTVFAGLPWARSIRAQEATPVPGARLLNIRWQLDRINSGESVETPDEPNAYWVQFHNNGELHINADCNKASASFQISGSRIKTGEIVSTKIACEAPSLSDKYLSALKYMVSYLITGDINDQLVLEMMADGGQLLFKPGLTGVVWEWEEFRSEDGSVVRSNDPTRSTIEFLDDGTVNVATDCNNGSGSVTTDGQAIEMTIATTLIGCPAESQSTEFLRYLDEAISYVIHDGRLALSLPDSAGAAFFRPMLPAS